MSAENHSLGPTDWHTQREDLHRMRQEYNGDRRNLSDSASQVGRDYNKTMLTLSTSAIGLLFAYAKFADGSIPFLVGLICIFFALAVCLIMFATRKSQQAFENAIRELDAAYERQCADYIHHMDVHSSVHLDDAGYDVPREGRRTTAPLVSSVEKLDTSAGIAFVMGVILITILLFVGT